MQDRSSRLALYLDLIRWDRPAGWLLLLWPSLSALWIAADGFPGWHLLAVFVLGTILMRSAGCCVNDVADRDFDRHVKRTAMRPVTIGSVSVREALALGAFLALLAFALVLSTNPAAIQLSVAGLAVSVGYPFAKRVLAMPQAVLGVAFSFGVPMAFAAALGGSEWSLGAIGSAVPAYAWWLLLGNLFWVLAYDTEYAMVDRDDDQKIGIRTSALTLGRLRRDGGDGLLCDLPAVVGGAGPRAGPGAHLPAGHRRGRAAGAVALHADPASRARRLLQGLPAEPLARLCRVCRRGAGPGLALAG